MRKKMILGARMVQRTGEQENKILWLCLKLILVAF